MDALTAYGPAIGAVESDGSGGYNAIGPYTRKGDRAYGRYQVMGANIPQWTQQALGYSMTPQEFLQNKQAQDTVFNQQFGKSVQRYGNPQDAASVWFTGHPLAQGGNRDDGYITGNEYVRRFNAALGSPGIQDAQAKYKGNDMPLDLSKIPPGLLFNPDMQRQGGLMSYAAQTPEPVSPAQPAAPEETGQAPGFNYGHALQSLGAGLMAPYQPSVAASIWKQQAAARLANKYGLTPVWGKDANGNYVLMQMDNRGGIRQATMPNGVSPLAPATYHDIGTGFVGTDKFGNPVGSNANNGSTSYIPKNGPISPDQQQTPGSTPGNVQVAPLTGSKLAGEIPEREKVAEGKAQVIKDAGELTDNFVKLYTGGGMVDPNAKGVMGTAHNVGAALASSGVGQLVGNIVGGENPTARNNINRLGASLINNIRSATGMGSKSLDSNAELAFYRQMVGDPSKDIVSNLAAIDTLDRHFGKGDLLQRKLPPALYRQVQAASHVMEKEHPITGNGESAAASTVPEGFTFEKR